MSDTGRTDRKVHHPIFARVYRRFSESAEQLGVADHRRRLLDGLHGRVVEVGAGNGLNFAHYPADVSEVVAVEPEPYLRERAREIAAAAPVAVTVVRGTADALPLADESVDAAVASLVLCSVPDQRRALAEVRRVLRPGGELRFYEHVAADGNTTRARLQKALDPVWTRMAGGCHLDRRTEQAIAAAGFEIRDIERFLFQPCLVSRLTGTHILGRAVRV